MPVTWGIHNSLRSRYAAVAMGLILLVLVGAFVAHENVSGARNHTSANIESRNQVLQLTRYIRDSVWQARQSLENFLLEPSLSRYGNRVHEYVGQALTYTAALARHPWIGEHHQVDRLEGLSESLRDLDRAAQHLIETRLSATDQYPALALARDPMLIQSRRFNTAASLAMDEALNGAPRNYRGITYTYLVQARHMWAQMVATFRMYLANRLGSFDPNSLGSQERDIATQLAALDKQLALLEAMGDRGELELVTENSLLEMRAAVTIWKQALENVKHIHHTNAWRTDANIVHDRIDPLLERTWNLLLSIDTEIELSAAADVETLNRVAQYQSRLLWSLTLTGLLFVIIGFFALERWILKPIAQVSEALKAEASGGGAPHTLPPATTDETRNLVEAFTQMQRQVHSRQLALEHQAMHDTLTDLPNRALLMDRLEHARATAYREHHPLALLMMDLDRFKEINDTLGHQVGDRLLQEVSQRLLTTVRESDTVARLGGDEFALVLPNSGVEQARGVAAKTLDSLEQVFQIDGHHLYISASIGIATFPQHGTTAPMLIQRADVAMYIAKRNKLNHAVYDPSQDQHSVGRLSLMSDLREAIDNGTLELHYQPKMDVAMDRVTGFEALLRWDHPKYGNIVPDELIPLAEQTGLIRPLTHWVVDRAVHQCSEWRHQYPELSVAVNLSAHNLQDPHLLQQIETCLQRHQLPPALLTLELTESAMMADPDHGVRILGELDAMGVGLAVDDFGTGFSSLAYLKQLPVDELKIDKSFVMHMCEDDNDAVIVRSIIDLSHNLGLRVVAEGVEDRETWDLLEILRCDQAQGYYMSRPMPAAAVGEWLPVRYRSETRRVCPIRARVKD